MRIWVISDLHLEFEPLPDPLEIPEADVCVAAGDISSSCAESIYWLGEHISRRMPVVYVAGNHEFYRNGIVEGFEDGRAAAQRFPHVHFLEGEVAVIDGTRFIGATLWTDFSFEAVTSKDVAFNMMAAESLVHDYRVIGWRRSPYEGFTASISAGMHERSRSFIRQTLAVPHDGPTVVVTHHAPHPGSVHPRYAESDINSSFVSDLSDVMDAGCPELWLHGHVHDCWDYRHGNTRVFCNPRGYSTENPRWDAAAVIEV